MCVMDMLGMQVLLIFHSSQILALHPKLLEYDLRLLHMYELLYLVYELRILSLAPL